jgi:hypothetical protein
MMTSPLLASRESSGDVHGNSNLRGLSGRVIRWCLWLERFILVEENRNEPFPLGDEGNAFLEQDVAGSNSPDVGHTVRLWFLFLFVLLIDLGFYLYAFVFFPDDIGVKVAAKDMLIWSGWEMMALIISLRTVALCPIHLVLGPTQQQVVQIFAKDNKGGSRVIPLLIFLYVALFLCNLAFNFGYGVSPKTTIWMWLAYCPISFVDTASTFLPYMLVLVTMRGVLIQLEELDQEIETRLAETAEEFQNGQSDPTSTPVYCPMVRSWLIRYEAIQTSMERFSESMAPWFGAVMMTSFLELSTFYIQLIQGLEKDAKHPALMAVAVSGFYICFTLLLVVSLSQLSQSVFVCRKELGPKISILATRFRLSREYALLSQTVTQHPIHVHVGTLEILPEHAITISAAMVTAYLVVIGYSSSQDDF